MELEGLPKDLLSEVLSSVNETGNRLQENVALLKQWISFQPHLPSQTYDERILGIFLRGCKHDLEKTKNKIDTYFTCRTLYPDLFSNRDPFSKQTKQALDNFNVVPLPKLTHDGYRICLHRYASQDSSMFDPKGVFQAMFMIADVRLVEEPSIAGDIFLFDVANINAGHFAKIVNPILKYTLHCAQDAYPQRLKEIHLFNAPPIVDRVVTFFKQFLKEKMRNRFHIHTTHETLYKFVPKSHLPQDYGGDLQPLDQFQKHWEEKLKSYKSYFQEQEKIKSDESRRPKSSKSPNSEFIGCEGAFRKLEID